MGLWRHGFRVFRGIVGLKYWKLLAFIHLTGKRLIVIPANVHFQGIGLSGALDAAMAKRSLLRQLMARW